MSQRTLHRLKGWALTPVHVGDGTSWTPEGYRLQGEKLERFDPIAVIGSMSDPDKLQYIQACKQGGVWQAQSQVQKAVVPSKVRETLDISQRSLADIKELMGGVHRTGDLRPFVRSGDMPILPGSSLKGALRTGWLAARTSPEQKTKFSSRAKEKLVGKTGDVFKDLQAEVFEYGASHTERDPLRDVFVADCVIAAGGTLLDKAQIHNLNGERLDTKGQKIQMHFERLAALADREVFAPAELHVEIATLEDKAQKHRVEAAHGRAQGPERAVPKLSPTFAALRQDCNTHHVALWFGEISHFYTGLPTENLMGELLQSFKLLSKDKTSLVAELEQRKAWLIRIGRFSHFESKSVEGIRHGEKRVKQGKDGAQGRDAKHMDWGGSRTVCVNGAGEFLPFGWIILFEEGSAPPRPQLARKAVVSLTTPNRSAAATAAPPRATVAPTAGMRFIKGDRVTNGDETGIVQKDVLNSATKMEVSFDGETENVNVDQYYNVKTAKK